MRTGLLALLVVFQLQAQSEGTPPSDSPFADELPTPAPAVCPAGNPIGDVNLQVKSPRGDAPLQLRTINRLSEGDTVFYSPILRGHVKRHGEVTLVLVPALRKPGAESLIVTDPRRADQPQGQVQDELQIGHFQ